MTSLNDGCIEVSGRDTVVPVAPLGPVDGNQATWCLFLFWLHNGRRAFLVLTFLWKNVQSEQLLTVRFIGNQSLCGGCYSLTAITLWLQSLLQNEKLKQKKPKACHHQTWQCLSQFVIVHHLIIVCFFKTTDTETPHGFTRAWAQVFWSSVRCVLPPEPSRFLCPIWWRRSAADWPCEQMAADSCCGAFGHLLFTPVLFTTLSMDAVNAVGHPNASTGCRTETWGGTHTWLRAADVTTECDCECIFHVLWINATPNHKHCSICVCLCSSPGDKHCYAALWFWIQCFWSLKFRRDQ